jgi:hypothetical protein
MGPTFRPELSDVRVVPPSPGQTAPWYFEFIFKTANGVFMYLVKMPCKLDQLRTLKHVRIGGPRIARFLAEKFVLWYLGSPEDLKAVPTRTEGDVGWVILDGFGSSTLFPVPPPAVADRLALTAEEKEGLEAMRLAARSAQAQFSAPGQTVRTLVRDAIETAQTAGLLGPLPSLYDDSDLRAGGLEGAGEGEGEAD